MKIILAILTSIVLISSFFIFKVTAQDSSSNDTPVANSRVKIAITPVGVENSSEDNNIYDNMEQVLKEMGMEYSTIKVDDLADYEKIKNYNILFLNCSKQLNNAEENIAEGVKKFVQAGGYVYASDWAYNVIEKAFPGKIVGDEQGRVGEYEAEIVDSGLAGYLGKDKITVNFDAPDWIVISSVSADSTVYIKGPARAAETTDTSPSATDKTLPDKIAYTVSFNEGKGGVLFTSFHNSKQTSADLKNMLNWFVYRPLAQGLIDQNKAKLQTSKYETSANLIDVLEKDNSKTYQVDVQNSPLIFILNFNQGEYQIKLSKNNQSLLDERINISNKDQIFKKEITGSIKPNTAYAATSDYLNIQITGILVPLANDPYVLTLAKPAKFVPSEINPSITSPVTTSPKMVVPSLSQKIKDNWKKYILYPVIGLILLIIVISGLVKIIKSRRKTEESGIPIDNEAVKISRGSAPPDKIESEVQKPTYRPEDTNMPQQSFEQQSRQTSWKSPSTQIQSPPIKIQRPTSSRRRIGPIDILPPRRFPSEDEKPPERR